MARFIFSLASDWMACSSVSSASSTSSRFTLEETWDRKDSCWCVREFMCFSKAWTFVSSFWSLSLEFAYTWIWRETKFDNSSWTCCKPSCWSESSCSRPLSFWAGEKPYLIRAVLESWGDIVFRMYSRIWGRVFSPFMYLSESCMI